MYLLTLLRTLNYNDSNYNNIDFHKVQSATSTEEFRSVVDKELGLFECGYTKATGRLTLADKEQLIKALWLHHVFFLAHVELEQLQKGFRETLE